MIEFYIPVSARERSDQFFQDLKEYGISEESPDSGLSLMAKAKGTVLQDTLITLQKGT